MNGVVQAGKARQPHAQTTVRMYRVQGGQWAEVARVAAEADGSFTAPPVVSESGDFFYATAVFGDIVLMAILGPVIPPAIIINELTTVAAAYSAAQFLNDGQISGSALALSIVSAMNANLVDLSTGGASQVMQTSPNEYQTNSWPSLMSLANFLAAAVDDSKALKAFFELTTVGTDVPSSTLQGLVNLARNPATHVGAIYKQSQHGDVYGPVLTQQPDAWTIVVKVNDSGNSTSGADNQMFGGPGSLAFDSQGRAWIPNNVVQGSPTSAAYAIVLDMSGRPVRDPNGVALSPITGGGVLGGGFGVAVDASQNVWLSDFGWGGEDPVGSVSVFDANLNAVSPAPDGYCNGVNRVQGVAIDTAGNVWLSGWGSGTVACYRNGNQEDLAVYGDSSGTFKPFGIAFASDGSAWVANSDGSDSYLINLALPSDTSSKQLTVVRKTKRTGKVLKGVLVDSQDNIWVASGSDHHVFIFDRTGELISEHQGGGMNGPWGIAFDGAENVWVGNFGPLEIGSVFEGRLTQLAGVNATGHRLGDALTPPTGYTLPNAGAPILLADNTALYGANGPDCYTPMMRTTGLNVDAAGNVWTCNNWKPDFDICLGNPEKKIPGNPGGDGMLIWVGLATPVA